MNPREEPGSHPQGPEAIAPVAFRIDGQYLQALMQYWTNLNQLIWYQTAFLASVQFASLAAAYGVRHSATSLFIMALAAVFTAAMGLQLRGSIATRDSLAAKANWLVEQLVRPHYPQAPFDFAFLDGRIVELHQHRWVRSLAAVAFIMLASLGLDAVAAFAFNIVPQSPVCDTRWMVGQLPIFPCQPTNPISSPAGSVQATHLPGTTGNKTTAKGSLLSGIHR